MPLPDLNDPPVLEKLGNLSKEATLADKFIFAAITSWLLAGHSERPREENEDSATSSLYQRAFELIDDLTDEGKLKFISELIPQLCFTDAEDITPPDCEFDDGLPNDLGNEPPSLMIA